MNDLTVLRVPKVPRKWQKAGNKGIINPNQLCLKSFCKQFKNDGNFRLEGRGGGEGGAHTLLHRDFHFRREVMAKRKRKVENDGSAFLHFLDSFKHISRFLGL